MNVTEAQVKEIVRQVLAQLPQTANLGNSGSETIALGADHGGFEMKEKLKSFLSSRNYTVMDCGTHSKDSVDYPDLAYAVARLVSDRTAHYGIVIDGAGIGSCMAANKVPGIRAAMCYNEATARNSREHNHANVLTLGAVMIDQPTAEAVVVTWLNTPVGPDRHARRAEKIMDIERRYLRKP